MIQHVIAEDYTFVTNNAVDFRLLYQAEQLHAGLVIIIPNVRPEVQRQLFQAVLDEVQNAEIINEVLEVDYDQATDTAFFDRYAMPVE